MKVNPTPGGRTPKPVTKEQIAALAHELWLVRGCPTGVDLDIWLEAERQLQPPRPVVPPRDPIPADMERFDPSEDPALGAHPETRVTPAAPAPRSPTAL